MLVLRILGVEPGQADVFQDMRRGVQGDVDQPRPPEGDVSLQ